MFHNRFRIKTKNKKQQKNTVEYTKFTHLICFLHNGKYYYETCNLRQYEIHFLLSFYKGQVKILSNYYVYM